MKNFGIVYPIFFNSQTALFIHELIENSYRFQTIAQTDWSNRVLWVCDFGADFGPVPSRFPGADFRKTQEKVMFSNAENIQQYKVDPVGRWSI